MLARFAHPRILTMLLAVAVTATACSSDTPTNPSGGSASSGGSGGGVGGSGGGSAGVGTLAIHITDSPFSEAEAVLVRFNEVSVHRSGAGWESLPFSGGGSGRTCDLKKLQGPIDVLGVGPLPAGHYTQIRLTVESADIYFDNASIGAACQPIITPPLGENAPVEIPSGTLKLNRQFTLESGGATTIVLDFDGDRSIKLTGSNGNGNGRGNGQGNVGRYIMTPVIGIVSVQ